MTTSIFTCAILPENQSQTLSWRKTADYYLAVGGYGPVTDILVSVNMLSDMKTLDLHVMMLEKCLK